MPTGATVDQRDQAKKVVDNVTEFVPDAVKEIDLSQYDFLRRIQWLKQEVLGNSLYSYILAVVTFLAVYFSFYFLRAIIIRKLDKISDANKTIFWSFLYDILKGIKPVVIFIVAVYAALNRLDLMEPIAKFLSFTLMVAITLQLTSLVGEIVQFVLSKSRLANAPDSPTAQNTARNLSVVCKVFIWIAGIVFLMDSLGYNVSTFLAGLGIGGIAIALAAQTVLGDTFNSFAIAMDRPFEIGDFVIIGDLQGTVEHIGLKTTRIRSLGGELLVFGNSDLTTARIKNYKKMYERRICFNIGVEYGTALEKVRQIPGWIQEAIEATDLARFDRAHFAQFGDFSLNFEIVFFVLNPDYAVFRQVQQDINFRIAERFEKENVKFAFPTQTLHLNSEGGGQPALA